VEVVTGNCSSPRCSLSEKKWAVVELDVILSRVPSHLPTLDGSRACLPYCSHLLGGPPDAKLFGVANSVLAKPCQFMPVHCLSTWGVLLTFSAQIVCFEHPT